MRSFRDSAGYTMAVAMERRDQALDRAEVIDLVHLPSGTRPTPFASIEYEEVNRCRVLDCSTYNACLAFAARLQWPSFHCRQCPKYAYEPDVDDRPYLSAVPPAMRPAAGPQSGPASPDASIIKLR